MLRLGRRRWPAPATPGDSIGDGHERSPRYLRRVPDPSLPILTRLWFALACLLRVLFDGAFAARAFAVRDGAAALPAAAGGTDGPKKGKSTQRRPAATPRPADEADRSSVVSSKASGKARAAADEARLADAVAAEDERRRVGPLQLLALLQREGRLVDFLQQDIASFEDADVGAAARVVHEGCRKALLSHATLEPVRTEEEESRVSVEAGYDPTEVKLTGNVAGQPPFRGVLRHRGWRVRELRLPEPLAGHDFRVVAPAEIEIG
jgi:hypothetical protein